MLHIIKFDWLIRAIVSTTVVISIIIYYLVYHLFSPGYPVYKVVVISSTVSGVLVYLLISPFLLRRVWGLLRKWNKSFFPDLNGTWEGTVAPSAAAPLMVRATIRQSLLYTQIDLHGETMKSITLTASPVIEQGQHNLYYVYRAEPKEPKWPPYNGTTKFSVRVIQTPKGDCLALSGCYYTDRDTSGTIDLRHAGSDPTRDVSFY